MADFNRPMNEKRSYYEFGKFISEGANVGTVRDALKDLQEELEGTPLSAPNEATASKLRKVYELYIEEYGFDIEELEEISALDLYRAQSNAFKMVRDRSDAYTLIVRMKAGEKFKHICREYDHIVKNDPVLKTKAEYLMEEIRYVSSSFKAGTERKERLGKVTDLANRYLELIRVQRGNASEAEKLLIRYNQELIELYLSQKQVTGMK